jgi:hypothetical protein
MSYLKTTFAARQLGIPYWRLFDLIRSGLIPAPEKDSSGDYIWTADDVERARDALATRQRRKEEAGA